MTDTPVYRMVVEAGRLSPLGPLDQEKLLALADGTEVECSLKAAKNGAQIRKLYSVVGLVVKQFPTPWKDADEAIQALKDHLGLTYTVPGVGPKMVRVHRSLNDLKEADLLDFQEGCWLVLQKLIGVDPLTLRKEKDDMSNRATPDESSDATGDAVRLSPDDSQDEQSLSRPHRPQSPIDEQNDAPQQGDIPASASSEGAGGPPSPQKPAPDEQQRRLCAEMTAKLFRISTEQLTTDEKLAVLETARAAWAETLDDALVKQAYDTVCKVVRGELAPDAARRFLTNLID